MSGRLVVVEVATAAPIGVLTWDAWAAMREAEVVYAPADLDPRWRTALGTAWIALVDLTAPTFAELAESLLDAAQHHEGVVWFGSLQAEPELAHELAAGVWRRGEAAPQYEQVLGSWPRPGGAVLELVSVMDRLRSPGGCPWDAEQTHASLVPYALEEAFEVAEAVEVGGRADLIEELGDLLLQVVFHARLGQEWEQPFSIDDVAAGITAKLKRRHPHVFGAVEAETAAQVEANWEEIKQAEKGRVSVFDGVPIGLPALARAEKVWGRFARAGLDPAAALETDSRAEADQEAAGSEIGRELLGLALRARELGLDPEAELRAAVRQAERRGREAERQRS